MANGEGNIQTTAMLPPDLHVELKIRAAQERKHVSDLLVEGARIVLKRKRRKRPADARASA